MSPAADPLGSHELAVLLQAAERNVRAVSAIRLLASDTSIENAYRIQRLNTESRVRSGERIVGRKIGLTSAVVQRQLGVDQPDFGVLFDTMRVENEGIVEMTTLLSPKIEAEIAFVLGHDLTDPQPSRESVAAAVECVVPCLEIVDSRIAGWDIAIFDTIADNGSSARFVMGTGRQPLNGFDRINCRMELKAGDELIASGRGAASLGDPLEALRWLAVKCAELELPLRAGEIILSGALGPMSPVKPDIRYTASIEGLGRVTVQFEPRS